MKTFNPRPEVIFLKKVHELGDSNAVSGRQNGQVKSWGGPGKEENEWRKGRKG